ncbi:MAG TPA: 50S ribosomal protein L9, partial [Bacillota bacterium]
MKVILKANVKNLGSAGQVVEVADGYGRNYLIPRGLAVEATPANLSELRQRERTQARQAQRELEQARKLAAALAGRTIQLKARAGENGRLFGSITAADIAEEVRRTTGFELDRRKIELDEPLRQLGRFEVPVRLHPEVHVT